MEDELWMARKCVRKGVCVFWEVTYLSLKMNTEFNILFSLQQLDDQLTERLSHLLVSFCVLFVCKCVLYYCHWVSTQLHLTNISISCNISYHITSHIISYIISYHIITYIISYTISYHTISYHIFYIISHHIISHHTRYHIIWYHISYHITSYHISYRIVPYRVISYNNTGNKWTHCVNSKLSVIWKECRWN